MRKTMSLEEKLQIMKRYINETGEEIKFQTKYNGYNLGAMKNNLRQKDFKGKLNISPELRKEFEEIGVLGEREKRKRLSGHEKCKIIIDYLEGKEKDLSKEDIKAYIYYLQSEYNMGKVQLSLEEIENLKKYKILKATPKLREEASAQYGISEKEAKYIINNFGSIEQFLEKYKAGEINSKDLNEIYVRPRVIAISSIDLPSKRLSKCISLFSKVIYDDPIKHGEYINMDKLLLEFGQLDDKEKKVIENELKDKGYRKSRRELAKEIGVGANYPGEAFARIIGRWTYHRGVIGYIKTTDDVTIKEAYARAYKYFMEHENVLNPNEIIPASIIRNRKNNKKVEQPVTTTSIIDGKSTDAEVNLKDKDDEQCR